MLIWKIINLYKEFYQHKFQNQKTIIISKFAKLLIINFMKSCAYFDYKIWNCSFCDFFFFFLTKSFFVTFSNSFLFRFCLMNFFFEINFLNCVMTRFTIIFLLIISLIDSCKIMFSWIFQIIKNSLRFFLKSFMLTFQSFL